MKEIFGARLKNARIMHGYSLQQLADILDLSKQMVSKYEQGKSMPDSSLLILLSKNLNLKPDYFFKPFGAELGQVEFRKKSSFSQKKINSLKERIKFDLENYLEVEDILDQASVFENPLHNFEISSLEDVEASADKLREAWGLGEDPIHNVIAILEKKKIKVVEIEDEEQKFDGLATYAD